MNRQAMREKVLGEMVVARDKLVEAQAERIKNLTRLSHQQGDKVLELLDNNEEALRRIVDISKCLS